MTDNGIDLTYAFFYEIDATIFYLLLPEKLSLNSSIKGIFIFHLTKQYLKIADY